MLDLLITAALFPNAATLPIELPGGRVVTAVVERAHRPALGDLAWRGRLLELRGGWFLLVANGEARAGEVSAPGLGHFHLRDAGDGLRVVPVATHERLRCLTPTTTTRARLAEPAGGVAAGTCPDAIVVDVLVVYSTAAMTINGGRAAIEAVIDSYLEYTNMAYAASGVVHRLRLVHAQEVAYADSGNVLVDLARLTDPADGHLDDVHALRDAWGADLVSLIADSPSAGVAHAMTELSLDFEAMAFSVIGADPAPLNGGLVFAHETGHNMGCHHNNTPDPPDALFCYSYGHRTGGPQWRTIMSSPPGTFVDRFSSPLLEMDGLPLGVDGDGCPPDAADNVRSLNASAATVARFRPTVVPLERPDANGDGVVDVDDLVLVLLGWGPCPPPGPACPGDVDGSGSVDVDDLIAVITAWGRTCP